MEIGAQLYTIRDYCQDLDSFAESLKKVADIGYKNVQVSGACEFEADWLKTELAKNGLKCVLTHTSEDAFQNDIQGVIADHNTFDCQRVGLGWFDFKEGVEEESLDKMVAMYKPVVKALKDGGKYFMYHNHAEEFLKIGNKTILEVMAEAFDEDELGFIVDTYWVQVGGGDPAAWLEKLSGRVPCIHLKDCAYGQKISVVGEGNINFDRVFQMAEKAGTEYMLVEQDTCHGENPFDCLKRSYDYLKSCGF